MVVKTRALIEQVVGADDRRIAAGVSAADPAFLDDRDVFEAVLAGQVVGGTEPMASAADYYSVIARLRCRSAPLRGPVALSRQPSPEQGQGGKTFHEEPVC